MSEYPLYSHCARYIDFIARAQATNQGRPVVMSAAHIAEHTGVSEDEQIYIRQHLMLAGRLRLSVVGGRLGLWG